MPLVFKSPEPKFRFKVSPEKTAITRHFRKRKVPTSDKNSVLLATWNIANFGVQGRTKGALKLIAHILKRFDLIAVQEVNDQFDEFEQVVELMGPSFDYVMSDTAGNQERLAYIYRFKKVAPTHLNGELAIRPREYPKRTVRVPFKDKNKKQRVQVFKNFKYEPFNRNPYMCSFMTGDFEFTLVNVHLYFGKDGNSKLEKDRKKFARRVLEIFALSRWADKRVNLASTYSHNIILLGDMNVPAMDKKDSTFKALVKFGWQPVEYTTRTGGSNLGNNKTYDQMVFTPGDLSDRLLDFGVFDFDKTVFKGLWKKILKEKKTEKRSIGLFNRHLKHHLSDHRPFWIKLDIA